jgi:putative peptidoglycan lipid II flippase
MKVENNTSLSNSYSDASTGSSNKKQLKRSLTIATIIMMSSVLLSRFTGLFREMVLADFGGTSAEMDAYVTSFLIPELLNHFLAGGFLSITFIPIFQRHWSTGNGGKAWYSFSNLITLGTIAFCIAIPLLQVQTSSLISLMGKQITDTEQYALTIRLTRIILPAQLFFYWGAFLSAVQMAQQRFLFPALAPLVYNVGIMGGGLLLGPSLGIEGFAWGVLIGAFAGNVLLQLPGALQCGLKYSWVINFRDSDFHEYIKKTLPLIAGLSMTFSNEVFFRFFGSYLPAGATSSVNYALRTMMMITAVFGQASGTAFYPFLVKLASEKKYTQMTVMVNTVLKKISLYLIPLSMIMIVLSEQIIRLLFERGQFTAESTRQAASVLSWYLVGSFAFSASMIVNRLFYAVRNTFLPMLVSSISTVLSIPLYILFCSWFSAKGIGIAATISMIIQSTVLVIIWYARYDTHEHLKKSFSKLLVIIFISAIAFPVTFFIRTVSIGIHIEQTFFQNAAVLITSAVPSLLFIFVLYQFFGIERFGVIVRGFIRK